MKRVFRITVLVIFALMIGFSDSAFAGNNRNRRNNSQNNRKKTRKRKVGHTGKVVKMGANRSALIARHEASKAALAAQASAPVGGGAMLMLIEKKKQKDAASELSSKK